MSVPMNLTVGAIERICNGDQDFQPLLQVTDIRLVSTSNPNTNSTERYRLLLSDGTHTQQGMLATQRNELVRSGKLQKGSIVQLMQFVPNVIQQRMIIIIIDLEVAQERCDIIGHPKQYILPGTAKSPIQTVDQPGAIPGNPSHVNPHSSTSGPVAKPSAAGGPPLQHSRLDHTATMKSYGGSFASNLDSGRNATTHAPFAFCKAEFASGTSQSTPLGGVCDDQRGALQNVKAEVSRAPSNAYARPAQPAYQQPPPMYMNRGPIARNEAAPRIVPIVALNPYQGRWTIKARVTAKSELRHYNNPRGDGKVFSFDLLDSDGGEIRVTCFNAVADQFYNQIEAGKVYMISKGSLKPAQKTFNHLPNDHEIYLETTSIVQPCFEDDNTIPRQQFHFRSISDVEGMENNIVVDLIGVVSSISPPSSIMRKNGTETQKRTLQLKDMSGRSVELSLWGSFCNAEGQTLQNMCDSGAFPVLAVKSGRINDFNGKAVGTLSTTQLFIQPDFPEAWRLKEWFEREGRDTPSVSISRETTSMVRTEARKTVSQIKDEKLGTSEKPDWITVSAAITFVKSDNFCYTACPVMIGDRQCNKKVNNEGDGKWRCDRCDQSVDECDYRYILQFQIQDHTGLTWVTAFQECGEEIMGISAKNLYHLKFGEEQDDEKFNDIVKQVLFTRYIFKLKVKEETFSDEQRVKSTVMKAEKVNFPSESRLLLDLMDKLKSEDSSAFSMRAENMSLNAGVNNSTYGNAGIGHPASSAMSYSRNTVGAGREFGLSANQMGQYGNQCSGSRYPSANTPGIYLTCSSCGGSGHSSTNCPSIMNAPGDSMGSYVNRTYTGSGASNSPGQCFKCHQFGHWARDCPGLNSVAPAYGTGGTTPGRYGGMQVQ
ncbi:hypothetical protein Ancab_033087 [Ancistrocladus abbreviatus]